MTAPYMPLFVSDYLADTAHLNAAENGAYLLLIMNYWQRGKPLPADDRKLARIARMSDGEWQEARGTLIEFFVEQDGEWKHGRIDRELAVAAEKSAKAKLSARASVEARQAKAERSLSDRIAVGELLGEVREEEETDISSLRSDMARAVARPRKADVKGSRLPDDWQPSHPDAIAAGLPEAQIDREAAKFRDFWRAKAGKDGCKLDWPATWRNWCRSAVDRLPATARGQPPPLEKPPPDMRFLAKSDPLWDEIAARYQARHGKRLVPFDSKYGGLGRSFTPEQWKELQA